MMLTKHNSRIIVKYAIYMMRIAMAKWNSLFVANTNIKSYMGEKSYCLTFSDFTYIASINQLG